MLAAFVLVFAAYVGLSFLLFEMPQTLAPAKECGFLPGEFAGPGELSHARNQAFAISFLRKQEYFTAMTLGVAAAFAIFALRTGPKGGGAIAAGGGLMALGAVCVSCLAPVLPVVGLGVIGSALAAVPKWLLLVNTLALTGWGMLFLSRRAGSCALPARHVNPKRITMKRIFLTLACGAALATPAHAEDSALLIPPRDGWPLANPMAAAEIAPPPFSLPTERGVNPAYVAGLPGLHQGLETFDDFDRRSLRHDRVLIRQSRAENGEVVIPPGGLAYLEDSWGGEVALRGEKVPILGRTATYIDYDMTVALHRDVTIPAGKAVAVGGTVYHYYAGIGHEQMVNHTLRVRTISGLDRKWAFGSPPRSRWKRWPGPRAACPGPGGCAHGRLGGAGPGRGAAVARAAAGACRGGDRLGRDRL